MNFDENIENELHIPARNNLLDFRQSDRTVEIIPPNIGHIENRLSGSGLRVCEIPLDFIPPDSDNMVSGNSDIRQIISAAADSELKSHRLRSYLNNEILETAMTELSECEMVCLAAGFLKWYDDESDESPKFAPLILMPVDIVRETDSEYFTIKTSSMNSQLNRTLADFLLSRFSIDIPELHTYSDEGENINIQQIFDAVRDSVSAFPFWEVQELIFISDFEYSSFAVWNYNHRFAPYGEKIGVSADMLRGMSRNSYEMLCDDLEYLARKSNDFGNTDDTPLKCCCLPEYSEDMRADIENCLIRLKTAIYKLKNDVSLLCELCGKKIMTLRQYDYCAEIIRIVSGRDIMLPEIVGCTEWEIFRDKVYSLIMKGHSYKKLKNEILKTFEISVMNFDASAALDELNNTEKLSDMQKFIRTGKIVKELNSHAKESGTVSRLNAESFCISLKNLKSLSSELKNVHTDIVKLFRSADGLLNGEKSDWDNVERSVVMSEHLREQLAASPLLTVDKDCCFRKLAQYYGNERKKSEISSITLELTAHHREFKHLLDRLSDEFRIDFEFLDSYHWQRQLAAEADRIINELPKLRQWTEIISIQENCRI